MSSTESVNVIYKMVRLKEVKSNLTTLNPSVYINYVLRKFQGWICKKSVVHMKYIFHSTIISGTVSGKYNKKKENILGFKGQ